MRDGSRLVGRSVEANGLRQLAHLFLTEIVRDGRIIAPVEPDEIIRAGDLLVFTGDVTRLDLLLRFDGLETHGQHYQLPLDNLVEVVVASDSTLARRTIKEVDFRSQFDAAVVAVRRGASAWPAPSPTFRWRWATRWCWWWARTSRSATTSRATSSSCASARCRSSPTRARAWWRWPASWA